MHSRFRKGSGISPRPLLLGHLKPVIRPARRAGPLLLAMLGACADGVTAPLSEGTTPTAVRWNALARELVIADRMAPPIASRGYAYLSVAQYASALAARGIHPDPFPPREVLTPSLGRTESAIAVASATILGVVFPTQKIRIAHELQADLSALRGRSAAAAAIESGEAIGARIAGSLETRARGDGADIQWSGRVPNGDGYWVGSGPQLPAWGLVRPWLWDAGSELRAIPPPPFTSDAFRAALAEVRDIADARTPAQLEIARFWADGAGTYTPPGHWNELAADVIRSSELDELQAARTLALVNVAMMDAIIGCWDTKYTYWVIRPYQADPAISTPIGQPPHPSYPSGHACSSSAAARVLAALFPARAAEFERLAIEACDSRVYAGIHYRFDAEAGMQIGEKAATRALDRGDALVRSEIAAAFGSTNE